MQILAKNINLPFKWRGEGALVCISVQVLNHPTPRHLSGNFIYCYEKKPNNL